MRSWHEMPNGFFFSFEVVLLIFHFPAEKENYYVVAVTGYMYVVHTDKLEKCQWKEKLLHKLHRKSTDKF